MVIKHTDCLIVGAGFSGLVMAEQLSKRLGWKCDIIEKRDHIGGNSYDYYDEAGVLVHKYGPHYFRTNSQRVIDYLSQFTEWHHVEYQVKSHTEGKYWNFPINLNTFEQLIGKPSSEAEFVAWLDEQKVAIDEPANSEEAVISQVGWMLYEKFYKGYTLKQWKQSPKQLDASLCNRVPIRTNRDDRYLRESFQAMPKEGYTALFNKMLKSSPAVSVHCGVDFQKEKAQWEYKYLVYTGPIDSYFDHKYDRLPYRSLDFKHESFTEADLQSQKKAQFWQPTMQVNYPDEDVPYTRIVEIKHATGQDIKATTIVKEYPKSIEEAGEPFYPVPKDSAKAQYKQYADLAKAEKNVSFIGRLAKYRYYNMDQVVAGALVEADKICTNYSK